MLAPLPAYTHRRAVCEALRDPTTLQTGFIVGSWLDPRAPVCFQGVVAREMHKEDPRITSVPSYAEQADWLGIRVVELSLMVTRNDCGSTFPELATHLEELPLCCTER